MRIIALAAFGLLCCSCATVVRGTNDTAKFESTPEGATVTVESTSEDKMGPFDCVTPCEMELKRKRTWRVDYALDGYKPASALLKPQVTGGGVASGAGNALIGGLIGIGIDAGTGANLDLRPNPMVAMLEPIDSPDSSQILDAEMILDDEAEEAVSEDVDPAAALDDAPAASDADVDDALEAAPVDAGDAVSPDSEEASPDENIVGVSFEADAAEEGAIVPAPSALDHSEAYRYKPGEVAPNDEESDALNAQQFEKLLSRDQ